MNRDDKLSLKIYKVYYNHENDLKSKYIVKIINFILENYENVDIIDIICNIKLSLTKAFNKNLPEYKQKAIAEVIQLLEKTRKYKK